MARAPAGWYPDPCAGAALLGRHHMDPVDLSHQSGLSTAVDSDEECRALASRRAKAGDVAGAIAELESLLAEEIRVLGPDHPDTLKTRSSLSAFRDAGTPAIGEAWLEKGGSITMRLRRTADGTHLSANFTYKPSDKDYEDV